MKVIFTFISQCTIALLSAQISPDRQYFNENIQLLSKGVNLDSAVISIKYKSKTSGEVQSRIAGRYLLFESEPQLKYFFNDFRLLDSMKTSKECIRANYDSTGNITYVYYRFSGHERYTEKYETEIIVYADSGFRHIKSISKDSALKIEKWIYGDSAVFHFDFAVKSRLNPYWKSPHIFSPFRSDFESHNLFGLHSRGMESILRTYYNANGDIILKIEVIDHKTFILEEYKYNSLGLIETINRYATDSNYLEKHPVYQKRIYYDRSGKTINLIQIVYPGKFIHKIKRKRNNTYIESIEPFNLKNKKTSDMCKEFYIEYILY